ncbi:hypothetical protein HYC85_010540 [Camellia sinensis]|uniref:Uncharacterized protein n=1 Tax=Camellia sinensis TaxID=4442 RepID=A0A7J7HKX2_CAMSI|nr:hypothetical protein HYC85_010540 [Camellia sinensis]
MDSLYIPCVEHAKQWLSNSNHPIDSDPNVTYVEIMPLFRCPCMAPWCRSKWKVRMSNTSRFLQSRRLVQDKRPSSSVAASELGFLRQRHTQWFKFLTFVLYVVLRLTTLLQGSDGNCPIW